MVADTNAFLIGNAKSDLPTRIADGGQVLSRFSNYGEVATIPYMPFRHALAAEGSYYSFFSATLDLATTEAGHAAPVLADIDATLVKAVAYLRNIGSTKKLYLDYIKIFCALAGANGTSMLWHAQTGSTARYTSGGVAMTVTNALADGTGTAATSLVTAYNGPIVIAAENATTLNIGQGVQRDGIEVVGDTTTFIFGADPLGTSNLEGAAGTHDIIHMPPVVLPPNTEFILGRAQVAQSVAGIYKVMGGFYLR